MYNPQHSHIEIVAKKEDSGALESASARSLELWSRPNISVVSFIAVNQIDQRLQGKRQINWLIFLGPLSKGGKGNDQISQICTLTKFNELP